MGLVSGAVHTTANTIRSAAAADQICTGQLPVSSVFFMLLPEQVYVYGDCAINRIRRSTAGRNRDSVR
ncbi:phosphate acyltransferase [Escherichia coli]